MADEPFDAADIVIPAVGENTEWKYAVFDDGRMSELVDGEWRPLTDEHGEPLKGKPVVHIDLANDSITVELVDWTECPNCEGCEGFWHDSETWVECDFCEGGGGQADLTPEQREEYLASWRKWMGKE